MSSMAKMVQPCTLVIISAWSSREYESGTISSFSFLIFTTTWPFLFLLGPGFYIVKRGKRNGI